MSDQKTTITADALDRLLSQFDGSPNLRLLVASYLDQVQELEDSAWPLLGERSLANATGDRLDGLGEVFAIPRGGQTDSDYRLTLQARLAVLQSTGTEADLLNIVQLLIQMTTPDYDFTEYFPKGATIRPVDNAINEYLASVTGSALHDAASAGTTLGFIYSYLADASVFTLSTQGSTLETSATLGLGPIYDYGGLYDWNTEGTSATGLSPGEFRFNNADPASATQIFVHDTDKGPADRDAFHDGLTGTTLLIELQGTSDRGFYCYVINSTDSGVFHTLDIEKPLVIGSNVADQTNTFKSLGTGGALTGVK